MDRDIEVRDTGTKKGLGVFALRDFAVGELVEEAPVLVGRLGHSSGAFNDHTFNWSEAIGQGDRRLHQPAIALGYGSLYNSANPANLLWQLDQAAKLMRFIAVRGIARGEELTINYSAEDGAATSTSDRWFTKRPHLQRIE